jgi:Zn-dependent protease with chaperone function
MVSASRALISVVMLGGFYVVALAQLGVAIALTVWLVTVIGTFAIKLTIPLVIASVGSVAVGMWKAIRARPEPPHGLPVAPEQSPALWATVHELAGAVGTRMPDEIRLIPEVNAAVMEESRLLGLVGGRRYLYVGLPLLQAMRVDQLRSVLAHELGHYSRRHTRFGAVAYRGRLAIGGTLSRIGPYNVAGWVFKAYGNLYVLVDNVVVRRQEYEADQASVRVAGRAAAASALQELPVLDAAWDFFFEAYVAPGWESGFAPDDLFGGYAAMLAGRQEELAGLRAAEPPRQGSKWDTHPPMADRIAAILAAPEVPRHPDPRPAAVLVGDVIGAGRRMQELMVDVGERAALPWPEFTHATLTARLQREADSIFRTIGRVAGTPQPGAQPGLKIVFDLIAAGRTRDIAEPFFPNATRREAEPLFAEPLETLLQLAAIRSGVAGWRHSWSGPAQFVDRSGAPLALDEIAKLAVSSGGLNEAYRRLVELGVDITSAAQVEQTASAIGADVIAALSNMKVDETPFDLLVLTKGFVLVANPGKADEGKRRLQQLVGSAPAAELAQRNVFLPFEDIAAATVTKRVPAHAELALHDGRRVKVAETWGSELITKNSRDVFLDVIERLGRS